MSISTPNWQDAQQTILKPLVTTARFGVITDMDGTLSPIVRVPEEAAITPRSRELLRALAGELALVAVVSGRAAADVQERVGLPELVYAGNHGLERWAAGRVELTPAAAAYRPALEAVLARLPDHDIPGMQIEDKGPTLSIHYRQTADPIQAAATLQPVLDDLAADHDLRLFQGRMVFELRPPIDVHKGTAFRQLVQEHDLDAAVYLGDDTTDVDALRMARALREQDAAYCVGVGVDSDDMPADVGDSADVLAAGVSGVEAFLDWLLMARRASST